MRILMIVVPSSNRGPDPESVLRLEGIIEAFYLFRDGGAEVVLASPEGGSPWRHRESETNDLSAAVTARFRADRDARDAFADTLALDQVFAEDFRAAFCVGEISSIWQAERAAPAAQVIAALLAEGKPVALISETIDISPIGPGAGLLILSRANRSLLIAAQALLILIHL